MDELARVLDVQSRETFADREELTARVEGRTCRVTLWSREAQIQVKLSRQIIPAGIKINEASLWGPQKSEAWSSGEAAPTGEAEFDNHFLVLPTESDRTRFADRARSLSPSIRSALIRERENGGLRDAEIAPDLVTLLLRAVGRTGPAPAARRGIGWALGAAFLGFNAIPNVQDLQEHISRGSSVAAKLEAAA
jgi:hypothetical protein